MYFFYKRLPAMLSMVFLIIPFSSVDSLAQVFKDKNFVKILPADKETDILLKAAKVVPSPRQLRWQKLELTAFFHFGINTMSSLELNFIEGGGRFYTPFDL